MLRKHLDTYFLQSLAPEVAGEPTDPSSPVAVEVRRGVAQSVYSIPNAQIPEITSLVREITDYGQGRVVMRKPWYEAWPSLRVCFGERPALYLNYNLPPGPFSSGPGRIGYIPTSLDTPGKRLTAAGLLIIPPANGKGYGWLINTSPWPPDQRTLANGVCCLAPYSRNGEVTVLHLEPSEALSALSLSLTQITSRMPQDYPEEVRQAMRLAREALEQGLREEAGRQLERAMIAANSAGMTLKLQRDPEFRILLGKTKIGSDPDRAAAILIDASYLAEEQGKDDLLPAAASLLKSLAVPDQPPAAASGVSLTKPLDALLRLAEIAPWDRSIWISLAEVILNKYAPQTRAVAGFREFTIPGPIAIAEAALTLSDEVTPMERMDPNSAAYDAGLHTFLAGIYLRSMPLSVPIEGPLAQKISRQLDKGLAFNPKDSYGLFLHGIIAASRKDWRSATAWMSASLQTDRTLPEARHALLLYQALLQGMPEPWRHASLSASPTELPEGLPQTPLWSKDGAFLAVALTSRTVEGLVADVVVYDVNGNSMVRISPGRRFQDLRIAGWDNDNWLYFYSPQGGGLWRATPDGKTIVSLSPRGYQASLSPDRSKLVFIDHGTVHTSMADGTNPARLTASKNPASFPVWHPSGNEVFYISNESPSRSSLSRVNAFGRGVPSTVATCECIMQDPSWVVPGEVMAVRTNRGGDWGFALVSVSGSIHPLPNPPDSLSIYRWSRGKGEAILAFGNSIIILDRDGKLKTQIPLAGTGNRPGFASLHNLVVSDDGNLLAYTYELPGATGIWTLRPEGDQLSLIGLADPESVLSFSPDGRIVASITNRAISIYRLNAR